MTYDQIDVKTRFEFLLQLLSSQDEPDLSVKYLSNYSHKSFNSRFGFLPGFSVADFWIVRLTTHSDAWQKKCKISPNRNYCNGLWRIVSHRYARSCLRLLWKSPKNSSVCFSLFRIDLCFIQCLFAVFVPCYLLTKLS